MLQKVIRNSVRDLNNGEIREVGLSHAATRLIVDILINLHQLCYIIDKPYYCNVHYSRCKLAEFRCSIEYFIYRCSHTTFLVPIMIPIQIQILCSHYSYLCDALLLHDHSFLKFYR